MLDLSEIAYDFFFDSRSANVILLLIRYTVYL